MRFVSSYLRIKVNSLQHLNKLTGMKIVKDKVIEHYVTKDVITKISHLNQ